MARQNTDPVKDLIYSTYRSYAKFSLALHSYRERVSRVIAGSHQLSVDEARRWAKALGCPIEDLAPVVKRDDVWLLLQTTKRRDVRALAAAMDLQEEGGQTHAP